MIYNEIKYPVFTEEMKKTHKILMPMMIEPHFSLLREVLVKDGYDVELLKTNHSGIAEIGLKYSHNDMCYPAILVIGQFIDALKSGKYDTHKIALIITQTGGGCRASNYIHVLRKSLVASGFGYVPVISLNGNNLEGSSGFKLNLKLAYNMVYAVLYGDLALSIYNQARTYEVNKGDSAKALDEIILYLKDALEQGSFASEKKNYKYIVQKFNTIKREQSTKTRVGIVGEIYLKYSALGNNNLEDFLISEGAEPVVSGLIDFLLYCMTDAKGDRLMYNIKDKLEVPKRVLVRYFVKKQNYFAKVIKENSDFIAPENFDHVYECADGIINRGVKMGEGWLLTAEMIAHIKDGVNNIVCAQPFGCLPNHIVAKGAMGKIKRKYPKANIVAIDYDPGASRTNQENRLRLMLMNAKEENKSIEHEEKFVDKGSAEAAITV